MIKEFKAFLMKGNLVDIAVAFILAIAFAAVVQAFVTGVMDGLIAAVIGKPSLVSLSFAIGEGDIRYGFFLDALLNFVIVGFVLFLVVKAYNRFRTDQAATTRPCDFCKTHIALDATRCPNCTSELRAA